MRTENYSILWPLWRIDVFGGKDTQKLALVGHVTPGLGFLGSDWHSLLLMILSH